MRIGRSSQPPLAKKLYCRGGDGWLTGKAAYEDLQLEVNPWPFDNPDRPQFRMTNAVAWAIEIFNS